MKFHVTYERVTEESAADGDVAERGYACAGGWRFPLPDDCYGANAKRFADDNALTLREAINTFGRAYVEDHERWLRTEPEQDMRTGDYETLSLHIPDSVTPTSHRRIRRLLRAL